MPFSSLDTETWIREIRRSDIECGCGNQSFAVKKAFAQTVVLTIIIVGLVLAVIILAVRSSNSIPPPVSSSCQDPECYFAAANILNGIDENVKPCDDFYNYACGRKISLYDDSEQLINDDFETLREKINLRVKRILEDNATGETLKSLVKAKMMYKACLNSNNANEKSLFYIQGVLKLLGGMPLLEGSSWDTTNKFNELPDLFPFYKHARSFGHTGILFFVKVTTDNIVNASNFIAQISPPEIESLNISQEFLSLDIKQLQKIMKKFTSGNKNSQHFEKDIINAKKLIQLLIANLTSMDHHMNRTTIGKFMSITKKNIWLKYLNSQFENFTQFTKDDFILVQNIDYFTRLPLEFRDYFQARTIFNLEFITFLIQQISSLPNHFLHQNILTVSPLIPSLVSDTGIKECYETKRWKKCGCITTNYFSHVIARKYAQLHSVVNRTEFAVILSTILKTFETRISNSDWLSSPTKKNALKKLKQMKKTYLYPEWVDDDAVLNVYYENITMTEDNHLQNMISVKADLIIKAYSLIETSSKEIFSILFIRNYLTVNAFYFHGTNSMFIMEGISQSPFYSSKALTSMNYGSLGLTIGHELTHGYDNIGSWFDGFGTLVEWMTPKDRHKFNEKAECFEQQYSSYVMTSEDLPGSSDYIVNGSKTLGENIADNGGALTAYWAYKDWIKLNGPEKLPESLKKFTSDQIFFISLAQRWCMKIWNGVTLKQILDQDRHSPNKFRVIGTLSNLKEFSEAFHCSENEKMNRGKNSCSLW